MEQKSIRMTKKIVLWLAFLGIFTFIGGGIYYYSRSSVTVTDKGPISVYQAARDHDDIVALFELERFWLTVSDYDPVFMLKYMAAYKGLSYKDGLSVWVAREGDQFVGFTACYFEEPGVGRILFLAVRPEFRGKGYGSQLVKHALQELHKMGAFKVTILTRNSNLPAQKIYTTIGFIETSRDQGDRGHVYYHYLFN